MPRLCLERDFVIEERKAQTESPKMVKIPLELLQAGLPGCGCRRSGEDLAGHLPGNSGPRIPGIPEPQGRLEKQNPSPHGGIRP